MSPRLGDLTASNADERDLSLVAAVTGLTMQTVRRKIDDARGNTLIRNVFRRHWPRDGDALGEYTIALARDAGLAPEIADVSDLSERTVTKRLEAERGNMLVGNAFPELYKDDDEDDTDDPEGERDDHEEDDDEDDAHDEVAEATTHVLSTELDLLGATHVVSARSPSMTAWLADRTGWTARKMRSRLRRTHGRTLLRNLLDEQWPIEITPSARTMLGDMRVDAVRRSSSLVAWVARILNGSTSGIEQEIRTANEHVLVRHLYPAWPTNEAPSPVAPRTPRPPSSSSDSGGGRPTRAGEIGPGTLVTGRWRILRAIGERGGFGTVFEVKDERRPDLDGIVMKVAAGAADDDRRRNEERLRSEVTIARRLTPHQNICAYLDDGLDQDLGVYFAIMKHAGNSLERLIRDANTFELLDALDVIQQVATGLDYAHLRSVVHHDLKPANILVQVEADRREVRIGDWGISRHGRQTQRTDGSPTVIASVLGHSPGYAAPEQWRGEARAASDQYCLALVFCSMMEGRVFTSHYTFIGINSFTPRQNLVLSRALSPEPEDRFMCCGQFVTKLREA